MILCSITARRTVRISNLLHSPHAMVCRLNCLVANHISLTYCLCLFLLLVEIIANITAKLEDRETAETVYLRRQLQLYDLCEAGDIATSVEEQEMNQRSKSTIQDYRMGKMFRNNTVVAPDSGGRGKQRMFSAYSFVELPTSMTPLPRAVSDHDGSRSGGSNSSTGSSNKRKLSFVPSSLSAGNNSRPPSSSRDAVMAPATADGSEGAERADGSDGAERAQEVVVHEDKESSSEEESEDEEEMELFDEDDGDEDDDPFYKRNRGEVEVAVVPVGRASRNQQSKTVVVQERKVTARALAKASATATANATATATSATSTTTATRKTTAPKQTTAKGIKKGLEDSQFAAGESDTD